MTKHETLSNSANKLPLSGVRVLDLATMLAGPHCATILGEFGAEVIKVELPGKGNSSREFGTMMPGGSSMIWLSEQRNKKCITLDLRKEDGKTLLKRLVAESDIVVENFMPGTLERWGLGYDVLKEVKDDIILVRVSAYGQNGPYIDRPGFARIAHGFAGLSFLSGEPDRPPVVPGSTSLGDYITGIYAAIGALMSYIARERHGIGQVVDIALFEGVFRMLDEIAPAYELKGFVRERMGPDTVNVVPHSHYKTRDGHWIALACTNDEMWRRMALAMGRSDLATPETYGRTARRVAHREEVNRIVATYIASMDREPLLQHCLSHEVPIGPIYNIADIFEDPQYKARETLVKVKLPGDQGSMTVPNVMPKLSSTPGSINWLGQSLGESNTEIYAGLLGLSQAEMAKLSELGVI